MNWRVEQIEEQHGRVQKYTIHDDRGALSFRQVVNFWIENLDFRSFYLKLLSNSQYASYYWEHPSISSDRFDIDYEFVLVQSDILHTVSVTPQYFEAYYQDAGEVVVFPNLGKDALLIVPSPINKTLHYSHLAQYVRHGNSEQKQALLIQVGTTLLATISKQRTWLSTSGLGVFYIHVRLDTQPKYYTYLQYRSTN